MNLFRSEEHIRRWSGFQAGTEQGIVPLSEMMKAFSGSLFKRRSDPDYVSNYRKYAAEFVGAVQGMGDFWKLSR